ncbi:hypothetical protein Tco_1553598 [Tanacetum coccineum]
MDRSIRDDNPHVDVYLIYSLEQERILVELGMLRASSGYSKHTAGVLRFDGVLHTIGIDWYQSQDPDYVPEPIYPEYIPLEGEHEFPAEEQPLPPRNGSGDYPMDGGDDGDDDDGDSSGDDADGEDEDEEDEDEEEEEEHLTPADSTTVIPIDELVFFPT